MIWSIFEVQADLCGYDRYMAAGTRFRLWLQRMQLRYGVLYVVLFLSAFVALGILLVRWVPLSFTNVALALGILGALSAVANQDEVKFRERRRDAMTDVTARSALFRDLFDQEGNAVVDCNALRKAFDQVNEASMRLHLLYSHKDTQNALDGLIAATNAIRDDIVPWPEQDAQFHNALQDFVLQCRIELGLRPGEPTYLKAPGKGGTRQQTALPPNSVVGKKTDMEIIFEPLGPAR